MVLVYLPLLSIHPDVPGRLSSKVRVGLSSLLLTGISFLAFLLILEGLKRFLNPSTTCLLRLGRSSVLYPRTSSTYIDVGSWCWIVFVILCHESNSPPVTLLQYRWEFNFGGRVREHGSPRSSWRHVSIGHSSSFSFQTTFSHGTYVYVVQIGNHGDKASTVSRLSVPVRRGSGSISVVLH